jgi:transcriptional regulator with XRE-family HTH domain
VSSAASKSARLIRLGANVRRLRIKAKLTQERLAELVGLNPRTIQKVEAGKLDILCTTLIRLQSALKCEWEELMADI